jgi:transcriptional regulator with XRE-family HTH domain
MATYLSGEFIKKLRLRKGYTQEGLLHGSESDKRVTLSRAENARQQPTLSTITYLLDTLQLPMTQFFCPFLEGTTYEAFALRQRLIANMEPEKTNGPTVANITLWVAQLEGLLDVRSVINRQFIYRCRAWLAMLSIVGDVYMDNVRRLVTEGMRLTFPEFDEARYTGEILDFEEVHLLHILARAYEKNGNIKEATHLMQRVVKGFESLPKSYADKERCLPDLYKTLTGLYMLRGDYTQAAGTCAAGIKVSSRRFKARYSPWFAYTLALCCFKMGQKADGESALLQSYFAYAALGMKNEMEEVEKNASTLFGVKFNTRYATRIHAPVPAQEPEKPAGRSHKSIGEALYYFRKLNGIKGKDVYRGLCTQSAYSKIENGETKNIDALLLEALFQRVGRNVHLYYNVFLSESEFKARELHGDLHARLSLRNYGDETKQQLDALAQSPHYQKGIGLQYYRQLEAWYISMKESGDNYLQLNYTPEESYYFKRLEALRITLPQFNDTKIHTYRLTNNEIMLIQALGMYHCHSGRPQKGVHMLGQLMDAIEKTYADYIPHWNALPLVMANHSHYTWCLGEIDKAHALALRGWETAIRYNALNIIVNFAVTVANCLYIQGKKEESLAHFAMAYHCAVLCGRKEFAELAHTRAQEYFGVTL